MGIAKWLKHEFSSGCLIGEDFKKFSLDFMRYIKKEVEIVDITLEAYNIGHYYLSGFFKKDGKYVYFSIDDVRFSPNKWNTEVLVRTARDIKDFKGGHNIYTPLKDIAKVVDELMYRGE